MNYSDSRLRRYRALTKDTIQRENSNYASFEKRSDALADELLSSQGLLGDYNTLVDKLHTETDLDEIIKQAQTLSAKNAGTSKQLDIIFSERQKLESEVKDTQQLIADEHLKAESQLNLLDDQKRREYLAFKNENSAYVDQLSANSNDIAALEAKIAKLQSELKGDSLKERAFSVYERLNEATLKNSELEQQVKGLSGESAAQEKPRLLEQVKQDNLETSGMERKIAEMKEEIQRTIDASAQMDDDPNLG
jgi:intraflagellar transport protein 74